jgi:hypothetical protein
VGDDVPDHSERGDQEHADDGAARRSGSRLIPHGFEQLLHVAEPQRLLARSLEFLQGVKLPRRDLVALEALRSAK